MVSEFLRKQLYRLEDLGAFIAGVLFLMMLTLVCLDVFMRYAFNNPFGWVVEVCEYMLLYITFLGAAWLLRNGGQVRVDIVMMHLPKRMERYFMIGTSLVGAVACIILFGFSLMATGELYISKMPEIKTLSVPKWIVMGVIPPGSLLLSLEFLSQAFSWIQKRK